MADTRLSETFTKRISNNLEAIHYFKAHRFDYARDGKPNPKRIYNHMRGIDFNKEVRITTLTAGLLLQQFAKPGRPKGNYYCKPGTTPCAAGVSGKVNLTDSNELVNRETKLYAVVETVAVLHSHTAAITDTWSIKDKSIACCGGAEQYLIPNADSTKPAILLGR